jgi:hypothetical protein
VSYARFGDDSDVYVFMAVTGHLECCGCRLLPMSTDGDPDAQDCFYSTTALIDHLRKHQAEGHRVPDRTFARLEENREGNDAFIRGGGA